MEVLTTDCFLQMNTLMDEIDNESIKMQDYPELKKSTAKFTISNTTLLPPLLSKEQWNSMFEFKIKAQKSLRNRKKKVVNKPKTHVEKPVQKKKDAYTKSSINLLKLAEDESFLSSSFASTSDTSKNRKTLKPAEKSLNLSSSTKSPKPKERSFNISSNTAAEDSEIAFLNSGVLAETVRKIRHLTSGHDEKEIDIGIVSKESIKINSLNSVNQSKQVEKSDKMKDKKAEASLSASKSLEVDGTTDKKQFNQDLKSEDLKNENSDDSSMSSTNNSSGSERLTKAELISKLESVDGETDITGDCNCASKSLESSSLNEQITAKVKNFEEKRPEPKIVTVKESLEYADSLCGKEASRLDHVEKSDIFESFISDDEFLCFQLNQGRSNRLAEQAENYPAGTDDKSIHETSMNTNKRDFEIDEAGDRIKAMDSEKDKLNSEKTSEVRNMSANSSHSNNKASEKSFTAKESKSEEIKVDNKNTSNEIATGNLSSEMEENKCSDPVLSLDELIVDEDTLKPKENNSLVLAPRLENVNSSKQSSTPPKFNITNKDPYSEVQNYSKPLDLRNKVTKNRDPWCLLSALIKGHLTRKLFYSRHCTRVMHVIRDTSRTLIKMQMEAKREDEDEVLVIRLYNQVRSALYDFHDIFFNTSVKEKMYMIRSTEIIELKENISPRQASPIAKLSLATQKSLERKRLALKNNGVSPKSSITSISSSVNFKQEAKSKISHIWKSKPVTVATNKKTVKRRGLKLSSKTNL